MNQQRRALEKERAIRLRLKNDFEFFAKHSLFIRPKEGALVPFVLNDAQKYIHEQIEKQLRETGKVRVIILKGRQQGASTYVEGRYIWRTTNARGKQAFILTHEADATSSLFEMTKRYYEHLPPFIKPTLQKSNATELKFDKLDSGYRLGTAGNGAVGRSKTIQFFHGSEVGFWDNAGEITKGVLQAVPDADGTEVILESTANGVGNYFHQQWQMAISGMSEYIGIFVPWFWQSEYTKKIAEDETISLTDEEQKLVKAYGLTDGQIKWRRNKIIELSADGADGTKAFMQEYPCTPTEAFQMSGGGGLIDGSDVMRARKTTVKAMGPFVVGVDPSRGGDRFSTAKRAGRKAWGIESHSFLNKRYKLSDGVAICVRLLNTMDPEIGKKPDYMFIDSGYGADLVDRLHELGYKNVKAISFAGAALDPSKYANKRNEMWGTMNEWLRDENLPVDIPDSDSLQADLMASLYKMDAHDRKVLLRKDEIKKLLGYSPDEGDSLSLTFAEPVFIEPTNGYNRPTYADSESYEYI